MQGMRRGVSDAPTQRKYWQALLSTMLGGVGWEWQTCTYTHLLEFNTYDLAFMRAGRDGDCCSSVAKDKSRFAKASARTIPRGHDAWCEQDVSVGWCIALLCYNPPRNAAEMLYMLEVMMLEM